MLFSLMAAVTSLGPVSAQAPSEIPFQGVLHDTGGNPVADGNYDITFSLYTVSSSGAAFWTETHDGGSAVAVKDGIFNVELGSISSLDPVVFDDQYYLGIKVGTDAEIVPRTPLLSVPYARALPNVYPGAGSVSIPAPLSVGTASSEALFTLRGPDHPVNGPIQFLYGDGSDQVESGRIRFVEATTSWRGAFIHYDGSASNRLHIGIHPTSDSDVANDVNVITVERSADPQVGIGTETPDRELTVNDTDGDGDAFVNVKAAGEEVYMGIDQNGDARLSVQTNTDLRIRTNGSTRVRVRADGDTEIWDDLEVDGEIRTDATGSAMMVPRAWGTVSSGGSLLVSSGNVSASKSGTGSYTLTITEGCATDPDLSVLATVTRTSSTDPPGFVESEFDLGVQCKVGISTWEYDVVSTDLTDKGFSFIIYTP